VTRAATAASACSPRSAVLEIRAGEARPPGARSRPRWRRSRPVGIAVLPTYARAVAPNRCWCGRWRSRRSRGIS
jgi:hypothetical protein